MDGPLFARPNNDAVCTKLLTLPFQLQYYCIYLDIISTLDCFKIVSSHLPSPFVRNTCKCSFDALSYYEIHFISEQDIFMWGHFYIS